MKIAVFTIKGGVGKSSLILSLSLAFSTIFGKKVLLVDTDLQADLSFRILGNALSTYSVSSNEKYGIGRFASTPNLPPKILPIMDNLHLIPMEYDAFISISQNTIMRKLSSLPNDYDIILIDTPPSFDITVAEELLRNVDAYFVVVAPATSSVRITSAELRLVVPMIIDKIRNNPYMVGIIKNNIYMTTSSDINSRIEMLNEICENWKSVPHYSPCVFSNTVLRRQKILNYDTFAYYLKVKNVRSIKSSLESLNMVNVAKEFLSRLQNIEEGIQDE